jgi:hypothetical protein
MMIRIEEGKGAKDRYAMLSCGATGVWNGRASGCSPAATRTGRSIRKSCMPLPFGV